MTKLYLSDIIISVAERQTSETKELQKFQRKLLTNQNRCDIIQNVAERQASDTRELQESLKKSEKALDKSETT